MKNLLRITLTSGLLAFYNLDCASPSYIKGAGEREYTELCSKHLEHKLKVPITKKFNFVEKRDNYSLDFYIYDCIYDVDFKKTHYYNTFKFDKYSNGRAYFKEGWSDMYSFVQKTLISEEPARFREFVPYKSEVMKTDQNGKGKVLIEKSKGKYLLTRVINQNKLLEFKTGEGIFIDSLGLKNAEEQIGEIGIVPIVPKNWDYLIKDHNVDDYLIKNFVSSTLRRFYLYGIDKNKLIEEKNKIVRIKLEKKKLEAKNRRKAEEERKKAEEYSRLEKIIESSIKNNLERLYFSVLDDKEGLPIHNATISITSDALSPWYILSQNGFPSERLSWLNFSLPYRLIYPSSWEKNNLGDVKTCETNSFPCSFVVYKTAKHKISITRSGYHEFIDEFIPNEEGFQQEIRMAKRETEIKINLFGGKGKRVKR